MLGVRLRFEIERDAVHAEALTGRRRAVRKHVAEVTAASRTVHLDPFHEETTIGRRLNRVLDRRPEARPSGAALEFRLRFKQRLPARRAAERAAALFEVERARASPLGAMLAQNAKLLGRQRSAPLV